MSKADRRLTRFVQALDRQSQAAALARGRRLRGNAGRRAPPGSPSRRGRSVAGVRRHARTAAPRGGRPRARLDRGGDPPPPIPRRRAGHGCGVGCSGCRRRAPPRGAHRAGRAAPAPSSRTSARGWRWRTLADVPRGRSSSSRPAASRAWSSRSTARFAGSERGLHAPGMHARPARRRDEQARLPVPSDELQPHRRRRIPVTID